jgi:hypothetical protein
MGSSLTRYFPGGAETQVNAQPVGVPGLSMPSIGGGVPGGVPGLPDFSGILARRAAIEAEREARAAKLHQMQLQAMQRSMRNEDADRRVADNERFTHGLERSRDARFRGNVQDLQLEAMRADEQALSQGPPLRMISGPGITPGYGMDTNAMNGRQRRAFLPNGSSMNASGAVDDSERARRDGEGFAGHQNDVARRRATDSRGWS